MFVVNVVLDALDVFVPSSEIVCADGRASMGVEPVVFAFVSVVEGGTSVERKERRWMKNRLDSPLSTQQVWTELSTSSLQQL